MGIARPGFVITTVDGLAGNVGHHSSITIGADGLPVIAYYDFTNADVKVAHCNNIACTTSTVTTVDSAGAVGWFTAIVIAADGLPLISYHDVDNGDLKMAHCNDVACASAAVAYIGIDATIIGQHTSIAVGADGLPLISYYDATNRNLELGRCTHVTCQFGVYVNPPLDSTGDVGQYTSIASNPIGPPFISYYDATNGNLKLKSGDLIVEMDTVGDVGRYTSIAIRAGISYYDATNGDLRYSPFGAGVTLHGSGGQDVGQYNSIAAGADGLAVISYYDATNGDLLVFHCGNAVCTEGGNIWTVDSVGNVGQHTSITIGVDGLPIISYYDVTNGNLKVVHCGDVSCSPGGRDR